MPAWSPEIAQEFIELASADGDALDQIKLQNLVYIAHGWSLAMTGEPLTGDRPEALEFGPEYRRLADVLVPCGMNPVTTRIADPCDLHAWELTLIARIYREYGRLEGVRLSGLTRGPNTPWSAIYANGSGKFRDIPHKLIREQFLEPARRGALAGDR